MPKDIVIIGGGAHAYSVGDLLSQDKEQGRILGYVDQKSTGLAFPYLGTDKELLDNPKIVKTEIVLAMGIGINVKLRSRLFDVFKNEGFAFLTPIHATAFVNPTARLGEGTVVFPGAMIGPGVITGVNVVIHTQAVVEHRTQIGNHGYVSPGVMICGECRLGERNFLGARSTLVENIILADDVTVGAGAVVLKSWEESGVTLVGIPAQKILRTV